MHIDRQTLRDLDIFTLQPEETSLFDVLNQTRSDGGQRTLKQVLRSPLSDVNAIRERQAVIRYLRQHSEEWAYLLDNRLLVTVERYLHSTIRPVVTPHPVKLMLSRWQYQENFRSLQQGVQAARTFFHLLHELFIQQTPKQLPSVLQSFLALYHEMSKDARMKRFVALAERHPFSLFEIFKYDALLRVHLRQQILMVFEKLYELDVFLAFARLEEIYRLTYPSFSPSTTPLFHAQGLYHLLLEHPKPYNVHLDDTQHLLFLTGPNMAGKTTFLKTCGVAVYLAHLGMAVPAASLHLSVYDALVSSVKTEEHLQSGHSYFYSEVTRMKMIAEHVSGQQHAFILLDELFKGTNIHDAYEASRRVIHGFANWPNHVFLLSSHLVELAAEIERHPRFVCKCFDAQIIQGIPVYSYQLQDGVSHTRLGLILLEQEQVLTLLAEQRIPL